MLKKYILVLFSLCVSSVAVYPSRILYWKNTGQWLLNTAMT